MCESVWSRDSAIGIMNRLQAVHQRNHGSPKANNYARVLPS